MGSDADPIIAAGVAPIHLALPSCAVLGFWPARSPGGSRDLCGHVVNSGQSCNNKEKCKHQRPQEAKQGEQA